LLLKLRLQSIALSIATIVGIIAAYLILGEVPTNAQYIGGGVILLGLFFSQLGIKYQTNRANPQVSSVCMEQSIESNMGFKGI
jgi:drug/metabolite transporter (DMT)-like permease